MENPLISIIICCYNRGHLLTETMKSAFAQEYKPVEIIVLDDGSTDNTPELLAQYGDRIRYYRQDNQGVTAARNAACRLAKGEYIAFLDDDDLMPPKRIQILYEALCKYPDASFAMGDWAGIDSQGNFTGKRSNFSSKLGLSGKETFLIEDGYKAVLWSLVSPVPHTTLFRKADGDRIGWFDTRYFHSHEDTDFFARCAQHAPIVYVPEIVSYYRQLNGSLCSNQLLAEYCRVLFFEKHLKAITEDQKYLRRKVKSRLLSSLKRIEFLKSINRNNKTPLQNDIVQNGLALMNIQERIKYFWYKSIRLPVKNMLKGNN